MRETLLAAGGVTGAVASSACCVLPIAFASVGITGVWIGGLTALAPYQPHFLAFSAACLAAGFWLVYRPSGRICVTGSDTASRFGRVVGQLVWVKCALWLGAGIVALTAGVDYGARLML